MSYPNVWAKVVFVVLQKVYLFPACHQILCDYQVSYVYVVQLVRFANSTGEEEQFRN